MLRLGQRVIVIEDSLEQNLTIGDYGYIIAYDRNADNIFDYVVRIPRINKNVFVPSSDIELEETIIKQEAEQIEREALIDYALATKNEVLFKRIMNGESIEDANADMSKEVQSQQDFIRQINLKAWI